MSIKKTQRGYYELWGRGKFIRHIGNAAAYRKYLKDIGRKENELATLKGTVTQPTMPASVFDVIYADPPWQYLGFPALKNKCQLIFLDPPYYKKKEKEYGTESISALTKDDYLEFFNNLALACNSNLSSKGRIALLMGDFVDTKEYRDSTFGWDYTNAFKEAGLRPMQRIQCPLSSESLDGSEVNDARNSKTIYIISRELIIFGV